ncbi:MAG: hypothetical protein HY679_09065 [Chloroflexi bacterium]|nr:hypothetical protein [Chloroflexota bacterium]
MTPLFPILVLLLGAGVTATGLFVPRFRLLVLVPVGVAALALAATLVLGLRLPAETVLSNWGADALYGGGLALKTDRIAWTFSVAVLLLALAAFLTGLSRPGGLRLGARTASLMITAAALAAIQAQDLVTLAITWAVLDLAYFVSIVLLARGEALEKQAVLSVGLNSAATFMAVAAALDTLHAGQIAFRIGQSPLTQNGTLFLLLAAVFRLGVFPFHLGLPVQANIRQGLGALLKLAPAAVALSLLAHLGDLESALPLKPWLSAAAAIGLLVGAVQWWQAADPRQGLAFVVLAQSSLAVLVALWGGPAAGAGVLAFGLSLLLGGGVLFLYNGYSETERRWVAAPFVATLALVGLPATVGFVAAFALYGGLVASGSWVLLAVCLVGQWLVAASCLRVAWWPGEPLPQGEPLAQVAYLFGLALPLTFAVISGLGPMFSGALAGLAVPSMLSAAALPALLAGAVAALAGFGLWRYENLVRAPGESAWAAITSVARLDWLYFAFWEVYRFIGRTLRTTAGIIEGEGGVLWTLVAALLVWLLFRSR